LLFPKTCLVARAPYLIDLRTEDSEH